MTGIFHGTGTEDLEFFFPFVIDAAQTFTNANEFVKKLAVSFFCGMWSRLPWLRSFHCSHVVSTTRWR